MGQPAADRQRTIGEPVNGSAVTRVESFEHDVLDDEIAISFELGTFGQVFRGQDLLDIDSDIFGFFAFVTSGPLTFWLTWIPRGLLRQ